MARSNRVIRALVVTLSLAGLGVVTALTALQRPTLSHAGDRPIAASASGLASTATSPSASTSASDPQTPMRPIFADDLPSEEKSEVPKPADWKTATRIDFDQHRAMGCELLRIREWVRLSCRGPGSMASHISGPSEGWSARTDPPDPARPWSDAVHWLQFPVRRGERRLMELADLEVGYGDGLFMTGGRIISVQWIDGEAPKLGWQ